MLIHSKLDRLRNEAEQGRILQYEKGTYLGKPDRPLTEAEQEALRQRTRMQYGL